MSPVSDRAEWRVESLRLGARFEREEPRVSRLRHIDAQCRVVLSVHFGRDRFQYGPVVKYSYQLAFVALAVDSDHRTTVLLRLRGPLFPELAKRGVHVSADDVQFLVVYLKPGRPRSGWLDQL